MSRCPLRELSQRQSAQSCVPDCEPILSASKAPIADSAHPRCNRNLECSRALENSQEKRADMISESLWGSNILTL